MMKISPLLLAATLLASAAPVMAGNFTSRLVGVWKAEGLVRQQGFGDEEKVRCRMVGRSVDDVQVNLEGKCATSRGAAKFKLFVAQDKSGKTFAALARLSTKKELVSLAGKRVGDVVTLTAKEPLQQGSRALSSTLTLTVPQAGDIKMTNVLTDAQSGDKAQSLTLTLIRKK